MIGEHNYTSILTLPESMVREAVRQYVEAGHAGADFRACPILGMSFRYRWPEKGLQMQTHITIQTGGF